MKANLPKIKSKAKGTTKVSYIKYSILILELLKLILELNITF